MAKRPFLDFTVSQMQDFGDLIKAREEYVAPTIAGIANNFVAGSIVWEKSLGLPAGPKMADGFALTLHFENIETEYVPGGYREIRVGAAVPIDGMWDGPANKENYVVYFAHPINAGMKDCYVEVRHAVGHQWIEGHPLPRDWVRLFAPIKLVVETERPGPVWLEPFELRATPFIRIYT